MSESHDSGGVENFDFGAVGASDGGRIEGVNQVFGLEFDENEIILSSRRNIVFIIGIPVRNSDSHGEVGRFSDDVVP